MAGARGMGDAGGRDESLGCHCDSARETELDDNLWSGGRAGGWRVKGSKSVPVAGDHSLEQEHSGQSRLGGEMLTPQESEEPEVLA